MPAPRATKTLVLSDTPERRQFRALQAALEAKRDAIASLDLEIETLRDQLVQFESDLQARLAVEHDLLARIETLVSHLERWSDMLFAQPRRRIGTKARRLDQRRAREIARQRQERREPDLDGVELERDPDESDRLKGAYRSLARRYHPDLARTEAERLELGQMMARINDLYRAGDLARLEAMVEQAKGGELESSDLEVEDQIELLEERLRWFDAVLDNLRDELTEIEGSRTCELMRNVEQAAVMGDDLLARLQNDLRQRVEAAYGDLPPAIGRLEAEVQRYNRQQAGETSLRGRGKKSLERLFDPFSDKRLVRLTLDTLQTARASRAAEQQAEWIRSEATGRPAILRLLLLAYVSEMSPFPLDGLDGYEKLRERFDALALSDRETLSLERALVEIDDLVEYGVRRATDRVAHAGLRFRKPSMREAIPVALRSLPIRRAFKSILSVLGERVVCGGCDNTVFTIPLYRTRGLDDLRAKVCPQCGHAVASYWMPRGKDVQAVLNAAYLDFELITEWSFRLSRARVAIQLVPVQVDDMTVRDLKRRLVDDLLDRYELGVAAKHVHLLQHRKRVPEKTALAAIEQRRFGVSFAPDAPMKTADAAQLLRHRIRSRFHPD